MEDVKVFLLLLFYRTTVIKKMNKTTILKIKGNTDIGTPVAKVGGTMAIIGFLALLIPGLRLIGLPVLLISLPIMFSHKEYLFDKSKMRFKTYYSILGMAFGSTWQSLKPFDKVYILSFRETWEVRMSVALISPTRTTRSQGYEVFLVGGDKDRLKIYEINSYFKARKIMDQVAEALDFAINDRYEEQMNEIKRQAGGRA